MIFSLLLIYCSSIFSVFISLISFSNLTSYVSLLELLDRLYSSILLLLLNFCSVLSGEVSPFFHVLFSFFGTSCLFFKIATRVLTPLFSTVSLHLLIFLSLLLYYQHLPLCAHFPPPLTLPLFLFCQENPPISKQHRSYTSNAYSSQCRSSNNPQTI